MRRYFFIALAFAVIAVAAPSAAPTAGGSGPPSGLTGIALAAQVGLAWQPVSGATGYLVYRGTTSSSVNTLVTPSPISGTSFTETGLANGTPVYYAVSSVSSSGESAKSTVTAATPVARSCSAGNPVTLENCFPGSSGWVLQKPTDVYTDGSSGIEGFATAASINKGQSLDLKVNTSAGAPYRIEIYRTGSYRGAGARLYSTITGLSGTSQSQCSYDSTTGMIGCSNWSVSATISTTPDWPSGVYFARLVRTDNGSDNHVLFVVRDDLRTADLVHAVSFTTYQAYNNYGGKSLYDWNSTGVGSNTVSGAPRAVKVSFDRPFVQSVLNDRDFYPHTDLLLVKWLEASGYDIKYLSNTDLERAPSLVSSSRAYVFGTHDEYWSAGMRSAVTQARDGGTSLLSPGGNNVYWKVRFENGPTGDVDRVLVCYKSTQSGGPDPSGIPTGTWRDPAGADNPENALLGSMYIGDKDFGYFPLVITATQATDRVYRHTNLGPGSTSVGLGLVGWEWDARVANGREPSGVVTLSTSAVNGSLLTDAGRVYTTGSASVNAVKYLASSGALVFNAGTNHWPWGLSSAPTEAGEPDLVIQQTTTNILDDMGVRPETPAPDIVLDAVGPPTISGKAPTPDQTDVLRSTTVAARFSRAMEATTIGPGTFILTGPGGAAVSATVSYDASSRQAILDPTQALDFATTYTARVDGSVKATDGQQLGQAVSWSFTTAPAVPPQVIATSPADGATGVSPAAAVAATFSRPLDPATVTIAGFGLVRISDGAAVDGSVVYNAQLQRAVFTPAASLGLSTTYRARLTTEITGDDGVALAAPVTWTFTTAAAPPPPPTVASTSPAGGAIGVVRSTAVTATFSRSMDPTSLTAATVTLERTSTGASIASALTYDDLTQTVSLRPTSDLEAGVSYTARIATSVESADGVSLEAGYSWSFTTTTSACPCNLFSPVLVPALQDLSTQDGRSGAGPWSYEMGVKIRVAQPMRLSSIRFFKSPQETGTHVGRVWTASGTQLAQVTFTGESSSGWQEQQLAVPLDLAANTTYVVSVNANAYFVTTGGGLATAVTSGPLSSVADGANGVHGQAAGQFPTSSWNNSNYFIDAVVVSPPEVSSPPTVTASSPADGATGVATGSSVTATFSRTMDAATITSAAFTLKRTSDGQAVPAVISYDPLSNTATLTPASVLASSTGYTASISTSVTAADGLALATAYSWSFATTTSACPCNLFSPVLVPALQDLSTQDGRSGAGPWSYEMGVKIRVDKPMQLSAFRFWRSTQETGTHVGRLWTASGILLAQATFSNESATGWQQQALPAPLDLQANTTYVVSVNANAYFVMTGGGLATAVTSGPLSSVADGANGVHGQAAGQFPTSSWNNSNYFVDLVVTDPPVAPDPPAVTETAPSSGAIATRVGSTVTARFSRGMDASTITPSSFTLARTSDGVIVPASVSYDSVTRTATLVPNALLAVATGYTATLSTAIRATDGQSLASTVSWTFTTKSTPCPCQLFSPVLVPALQDLSTQDGRSGAGPWSYEMGVKIRVAQPMRLSSIRFFKSPQETGTHVGRVWTASGTQLAQVTFTGESSSGWQEQQLAVPLDLAANTTYVVSVNANAYFVTTGGGLATAVTSGPLSSVADGANGVHGQAAGQFPTSSWNNSNYFVDAIVDETSSVPGDTTAPTVSITAPPAGSLLVGSQPVSVNADASDNDAVAGVQFKLDGNNLGTEDTSAPYSVSWDPSSVAGGSHALTAVARDAAGNTTTSASVSVTVDNSAPTVSVSQPAPGSAVAGAQQVTAAASDDVGVAGVQFRLDGAVLGAEDTVSPYAVSWDTTTATNGSHTLTAVARDTAGNVTTSSSVTVTVDNQAPTVAIAAPLIGSLVRAITSVAAIASDNGTVAGVQFKLDGNNLGAEVTAAPYTVAWSTSTATNGAHVLTAVARDAAGNTTTSASVSVTVDNSAPTVSVTAPTAGASVSGSVSVTATAADNAGVVGVQFKVDGTDLGVEDTTSPYSVSWATTTAANGSHTLTAVARDAAGNATTSGTVAVIVSNGVATIQGTVTDGAAAQPISGATVTVTGGPSTVTDAAGFYRFTGVTPGTYIVTVWKSGYVNSASYGVIGSSGAATVSNVSLTTSETVLVSSTTNGTAGGVAFADEDIIGRSQATGAWSMVFDGSDVGVGGVDVDAFSLLDDGTLLMSFDAPVNIPGLRTVDDSDIVRFTPTSLGTNTAGSFSSYLVGSSVGLTTDAEDIDAIGFTPDKRLVVSTTGSFAVNGAAGNDEDLIVRNAVNTWALYFDGSDVGLNDATSEEINGVWIDSVSNALYLTTLGNFTVAGLSGAGADVFVCAPGTLGDTTTCTFAPYWAGASNGFAGEITDGVHIARKRP